MDSETRPGATLARGVVRHLRDLGMATLCEFVPAPGLRVDVLALGPRREIWIVECKSSRADFAADRKWTGYLAWCDRFFWAVGADFPAEILPPGTGLIRADGYDGQIVVEGECMPLASARRRALIERVARAACERLAYAEDLDVRRRLVRVPER